MKKRARAHTRRIKINDVGFRRRRSTIYDYHYARAIPENLLCTYNPRRVRVCARVSARALAYTYLMHFYEVECKKYRLESENLIKKTF